MSAMCAYYTNIKKKDKEEQEMEISLISSDFVCLYSSH